MISAIVAAASGTRLEFIMLTMPPLFPLAANDALYTGLLEAAGVGVDISNGTIVTVALGSGVIVALGVTVAFVLAVPFG